MVVCVCMCARERERGGERERESYDVILYVCTSRESRYRNQDRDFSTKSINCSVGVLTTVYRFKHLQAVRPVPMISSCKRH